MLLNAKWVITPSNLCVGLSAGCACACAVRLCCRLLLQSLYHLADCVWVCIMNQYVLLMRTYAGSIWECRDCEVLMLRPPVDDVSPDQVSVRLLI